MYITGNQYNDWITIQRLHDTFKRFYTAFSSFPHAIEIVTLIPRFPLSANNCAMEVSNTRQSEFKIADETPSWIERGIASHVRRLLCPFSSSLLNIHIYVTFPICFSSQSAITIMYIIFTYKQNFLLVSLIQSIEQLQKIVDVHHISLVFQALA